MAGYFLWIDCNYRRSHCQKPDYRLHEPDAWHVEIRAKRNRVVRRPRMNPAVSAEICSMIGGSGSHAASPSRFPGVLSEAEPRRVFIRGCRLGGGVEGVCAGRCRHHSQKRLLPIRKPSADHSSPCQEVSSRRSNRRRRPWPPPGLLKSPRR